MHSCQRKFIKKEKKGQRRTLGDGGGELRVRERHGDDGVRLPQDAFRGVGVVGEQRDGGGPEVVLHPRRGLCVVRAVLRDRDDVSRLGLLEGADPASVG